MFIWEGLIFSLCPGSLEISDRPLSGNKKRKRSNMYIWTLGKRRMGSSDRNTTMHMGTTKDRGWGSRCCVGRAARSTARARPGQLTGPVRVRSTIRTCPEPPPYTAGLGLSSRGSSPDRPGPVWARVRAALFCDFRILRLSFYWQLFFYHLWGIFFFLSLKSS